MDNKNTPPCRLDQYLDLCRTHRDTIAAHSPQPLNDARDKALRDLARDGKDVHQMFGPDYGLNISRLPVPSGREAFHCHVPAMSALMAIVTNDTFNPTQALAENGPKGLTVTPFSKAPAGVLEKYYDTLAKDGDIDSRLNTLLAQDGVLVKVDKGAHIDKLLQIVNLFTGNQPVMAVRRLLIVLEDNATLKMLLCDHTVTRGTDFLSSQNIEIFLAPGSSLELYATEDSTPGTSRRSATFATLGRDSRLKFNSTTLNGGTTVNTYDINLTEPGADADLSGLVVADADRRVSNDITLRHSAPHCTSRQVFKYALYDRAHCAFGGNIIVGDGAYRTDASQTNRNLLNSPEAHMDARPQLEIYCDDVKCSHGATTGQIDAQALFYMRSRGIPLAEARNMLVQAFMADVIDNVGPEHLRDRIRMLVDKRLCGVADGCSDCLSQCSAK